MVRTIFNGAERQNYPMSDMIFSAQQLVSKISHDMTLLPGDLIACGTSVGVGVMKEPVNTVTVVIDGIGELTNEFRQQAALPETCGGHRSTSEKRHEPPLPERDAHARGL